MSKLIFVSLRAFGDFVIASQAMRIANAISSDRRVSLLAGEHLYPLAAALKIDSNVQYVASGSSIPAIFDLRRCGVWEGFMSLMALRREFSVRTIKGRLIFDRWGWREMYFARNGPHAVLPKSPNIYCAYEEILLSAGFMLPGGVNLPKRTVLDYARNKVIIVPHSRLSRKSIPMSVLRGLYKALKSKGVPCELIVFEEEDFDTFPDIPTRRIPRSFTSLIETILSASMVFSADSLSAHLAEYYQIPVFVCTPTPNIYWLPRSAFESCAWALFSEIDDTNISLERFISSAGGGG